MSEKYRPLEAHSSEKESPALSHRKRLELIERLRKSGEVLPSKEREPVPGATGDDSQQANAAASDDTTQNNGRSDSTTAPASQSDNQQPVAADEQSERERLRRERAGAEIARLLRIERIRTEIAQEYAKGDKHTPFRPDQS